MLTHTCCLKDGPGIEILACVFTNAASAEPHLVLTRHKRAVRSAATKFVLSQHEL